MNATPALRQADVPTLAHWIGGKRSPGTSGRFGDVYTPATGVLGSRVPFATAVEVARAVEAAKAVFPGWAATTPLSRARVMFKFKALLEQRAEDPRWISCFFGTPPAWIFCGPLSGGMASNG